jgi:quercetin dioxygenase-like cupin family protein
MKQLLVGLVLAVVGTSVWAEEPAALELSQSNLLEREMDMNGGRLRVGVLRVKLPVGFKTPLHTHEGPGPRFVVKGKIKIEESGQTHVYGVGDTFWETGQWMTAENVGDEEVELIAVEIANTKK